MKNLLIPFLFLVAFLFSNNVAASFTSEKDSTKNSSKNQKKSNEDLTGRIIGLKIGGGSSNVSDFKNFQKHKGAFYVGLSKEFLFTNIIGLSVEANYWLTGYTNETTLVKTSFNYISVPLMLNINIKKLYIGLGLYGALNLRSSERFNNDVDYYGFQNNKYSSTDWGAVFNIGFKWRFLGFDLRYVMGLQDVVKYLPGNQFNSTLFFGTSFHIMKKVKKK